MCKVGKSLKSLTLLKTTFIPYSYVLQNTENSAKFTNNWVHFRNCLVAKLEDALDMTEEEFKAKFSRDKPKKSQELIFHCKMGGRAAKGAELAISNGYTK